MASRKEERANKRTQIVTVHEADGDWREKARQLNVPTGIGMISGLASTKFNIRTIRITNIFKVIAN